VLVLVPPKEVQKQISDEIAKVLSMRKEVFKAGEKVIEEVGSLVDKMIKA
jgi:superfamily II DNA or RNA helicase